MHPILIMALALAGSLIGWGQRAVIARLAGPAGQPEQLDLPGGQPLPGHCRAGRARPRPPVLATELTTALLLGGLAARLQPGLVLAAAAWLATFAGPLAWVDVAVHRLPDALTAPAYAGTVVLLLLATAGGGQWHDLARAMAGGAALTAGFLALLLISPAGMGAGDVKLAASTGTLLAWSGWPALLAGTFAGFLLAALAGAVLLALRRATRKHQLPFGPFLIAGTFLVILAGGR